MPSFDPPPVPLARPAVVVRVARYDPDAEDAEDKFFPLPNVRALDLQQREGANPGAARFRYIFDAAASDEWPRRAEQVMSLDAQGPYVVRQDDRIVILKDDPDGRWTVLFDGFAQAPQLDLGGSTEVVTFQALGVAVRCWDEPIPGALCRDADAPSTVSDVATGLPARFNPDGRPNCVPDDGWAGSDPRKYPTFLDVEAKKATDVRTKWTLAKAFRYLIMKGNAEEEYVDNPTFAATDKVLKARRPKEGEFYNASDSSTYDEVDIDCQDFDATGDPWPVAVSKLIEPHGFQIIFRISTTAEGDPQTKVEVTRRDGGDAVKPKSLLLQTAGSDLDPGKTNLGSLSLSRDATGIVNRWVLDSEPIRYEASFVLAPGFEISGSDASAASTFVKGNGSFWDGASTTAKKYREFVFDETGEGHWNWGTSATVTTVPSLDAVLGSPIVDPVTERSTRRYARRRRPGIRELITTDNGGKTMVAQLWASTDYAGPIPGVWDGTGTWKQVVSSEWESLKDRLGVLLTMANPNNWQAFAATSGVKKAGLLALVKALAASDSENPRIHFRLTCVIEGDEDLDVVAAKRAASATSFQITRRADVRDRFRKRIVSTKSHFNTTGKDVVKVDDEDEAKAHVQGLRMAHEAAKFAGAPEIPRFTAAYRVGDKIKGVKGREIGFGSKIGTEQGEGARYPSVAAISYTFEGRQRTTLHLEDRRAEPPARRTR